MCRFSMQRAARSAGVVLQHSCRTGRCGACKCRVIQGQTQRLGSDESLSVAEKVQGWILTCTFAAADSELQLDTEDVSILANYPARTTPCRIDGLELLAPDVMRVTLRFPPNGAPLYLAGQYADVIGPGGIRRSYSIANAPDASGKVELHVRRVPGGALSRYWFEQARAGDLLRLDGPKGSFYLRDVAGLDLVFMATGTGYAPVQAMLAALTARELSEQPRSITLYWGGRTPADLYRRPSAPAGAAFRFVPVLSRADNSWSGARGYVQHALLADRQTFDSSAVYACGSMTMIADASTVLEGAGLPNRRFFSDAFVSSSAH
ncbi:FAD-binding oxidoreductase [Xylophilus sp.]|uniref:FAD-binding oxidoreductase n=1 Tax=Xylophilus sp. TaxID=2653893 RepID=UPI0013B7BCA0|nr:FAD-binding oxidoreductase [Xylophilus sp.]KAF1045175.1 MAG: CDP-6-deoxy-L-threo-D-glycero-4-hexulose-3-dehydrase reductase [Xylophilus sp.]